MDASPEIENGFGGVTACLTADRNRLEEAQRSVSEAVAGGRMAHASARYAEFEGGLLRHLRLEEDLVFPVFEARSGIVNGPTFVMREEHRQIRTALGLMREGLRRSDAAAYGDGLRFLESVLPDHSSKEQHILYPTLDRLLRPAERATLVARLLRELQ